MNKKEAIDKVINAVAVFAITSLFVGALIAIWIGLVGVKILLSAVVLFIADGAIAFRITVKNKDKKGNERGRHEKE